MRYLFTFNSHFQPLFHYQLSESINQVDETLQISSLSTIIEGWIKYLPATHLPPPKYSQ
ncbi:hypothetical protein BPUTEOMOX_2309 [methanotrophic endosymbiont of Bathymodiolus puteoserpentis (Logatchev)]|jgi:predicted oxidoreductase|nr:hypothetical protein BPUTEOMOX_2309 [methanotrophic endosymbiont of Bathymodiolus puteoserpentis (Logatchev)]